LPFSSVSESDPVINASAACTSGMAKSRTRLLSRNKGSMYSQSPKYLAPSPEAQWHQDYQFSPYILDTCVDKVGWPKYNLYVRHPAHAGNQNQEPENARRCRATNVVVSARKADRARPRQKTPAQDAERHKGERTRTPGSQGAKRTRPPELTQTQR